MQGLVAAALEKRQTGHWPKQPPAGLPQDPFAPGNPLKYQCRTLEVCRPTWVPEAKSYESRTEMVKGVRLYSVGPNGQDDRGLLRRPTHSDDQALWFQTD